MKLPVSGTVKSNVSVSNDSSAIWQTDLTSSDPNSGHLRSPDLYIMKVTLKNNGNVIDVFFTQFGIRHC